MVAITVHAACAISLNGMIGKEPHQFEPLTGPSDRRRLQAIRTRMDAVLIGSSTFLSYPAVHAVDRDRPLLHVIWTRGQTPLPVDVSLFQQGKHPVWVCSPHPLESLPSTVQVVIAASVPELLSRLEDAGVQTLLVEGGGQVIQAFLEAGYLHWLHLTLAPLWWANAIPLLPGGLPASRQLVLASCETGPDSTAYLDYRVEATG